jgi:uncharacterized protein (DUF433 family)
MNLNAPVNHIEIVGGQARIVGQAVKVKMIVNMHLRGGASIEAVMEQYDLSASEVYAALAYYHDNQAEFDHQYQEDQTLLIQLGIPSDELLARLRSTASSTENNDPLSK